jgi:hypothetical protein
LVEKGRHNTGGDCDPDDISDRERIRLGHQVITAAPLGRLFIKIDLVGIPPIRQIAFVQLRSMERKQCFNLCSVEKRRRLALVSVEHAMRPDPIGHLALTVDTTFIK